MPNPMSRRDSRQESHDPSPTKPYQAQLSTSTGHPIHPTKRSSTPAQNTMDGSTPRLFPAWVTDSLAQQAEDSADKADRIWGPGTGDEARLLAHQLRNPESTTETTDQRRPVVDSVARVLANDELMDAIDLGEESWFWPVGGEVADVGDVLRDLRATRLEVDRLAGQVAALEQLRSADIAVIGKLSAAVATQRPLAELRDRYLDARQHTLSTAGLPWREQLTGQASYVEGEAMELKGAVEALVYGTPTNAQWPAPQLEHVRHEVADVVISVTVLAGFLGVTVEACIAEKTEHDRGRG